MLITDIHRYSLYQGSPTGQFVDVTETVGLPTTNLGTSAAAWVDIDGDGWEDLILSGKVYRNDEGKRFTDYTSRFQPRIPPDVLNISVADYDRDGRMDLYFNRHSSPDDNSWLNGQTRNSKGHILLHNKGDWVFENVTRSSGTLCKGISVFNSAWLDANNDGWPDLYVGNEFGDGQLMINNRDGTFSSQHLADRPADFGTMGFTVGDVNNDGKIDIYCANMYSKAGKRVIGNMAPDSYTPEIMEKLRRFVGGSQLHLNRGNLKFEQVGPQMGVAAVGWAYGPCLADFDNDGWLDIYATAGFSSRNRDEPDG